ncbi:MAG: NAD-dependent epimerase/dehydratase family protein, partial [Acidobacteria bacterium]
LLDLLEDSPGEVVAWRRPEDALPAGRSGKELRWMSLNVLDRHAVEAAVSDVRPDHVYHCAGAAHVGASWARTRETLQVNVLGTHYLLEALRRSGRPARVLLPGSAYVYRQCDHPISEEDVVAPASPYALSKLAQEMAGLRAANDDGVEVLLPRAFNHFGPRQDPSFSTSSFAQQVAAIEAGLAEPVINVGNLSAKRDLTDVRDTVRAYRRLMEAGRPGVIYNVCSGKARRVGDVLEALIAAARVPIAVRTDPARIRPQDADLVGGDPSGIQRETGWAPVIPFERSIGDLLHYWRGGVARAGDARR